jgi:hypothetical protein
MLLDILVVLAAVWVAGAVLVVALVRAAKRGDAEARIFDIRHRRTLRDRRRWPRSSSDRRRTPQST